MRPARSRGRRSAASTRSDAARRPGRAPRRSAAARSPRDRLSSARRASSPAHRRDPQTAAPGARTASTDAPWPAAAANSCSTARSSNVFARSVRPIGPASRSPSARSSATSWTGEPLREPLPAGSPASGRRSSRPRPSSPARAWTSSRQVWVSIPYCLRSRVASAAFSAAALVSSPIPPPAAARSISWRRFENSLSTASGTSASSAAPLAHLTPLQPEPLADAGTQVGLVEVAGGLRGPIQRRAMQRREAPVRTAREVRRDHVGMQLRIQCAAHPMPVGRGDQPLPGGDPLAAVAATDQHRAYPRGRRARRGPPPRAPAAARASPRPGRNAASTLTDFGAENVRSSAAISGSRADERRRSAGRAGPSRRSAR